MSDRPPAVLTRWQRRALRSALRQPDLRALAAFRPTGAPSAGGPNPLMEATAGATMEEEIERVAATDADELGLGIERATRAGRPTVPWRGAHRDPASWLDDYAGALRLVWSAVEPLWRSAAGWLDRELARLEVASVRLAGGEVVGQGGLPGRVTAGAWLLPSHTLEPGRLRVAGSLRLIPLVAAPPAGGWSDDYADTLTGVRYTPTARLRDADPEPRRPESLEALLGVPRAALLRALDRPQRAGRLAELLLLAPSGVTHHLDALEAARLVSRRREGRHVIVRRTARATALLALYGRA